MGEIKFVAQGKEDPAKFAVVPNTYPVSRFAQDFFLNACGLQKPQVLLSVTGGAQDFKMLSSKLEQIFTRGLMLAAQNSNAWIVTGGLDAGVMKFVGDSAREQDNPVPIIGIATFSKVSHNDKLLAGNPTVEYSPEKPNDDAGAALNPDHSHFVLIQSKENKWGQEIKFRTELEDFFSREWHVPLVLVAINGGPGTLQTVAEGAQKKFPIIIVEGSGRASDAMASYLRNAQDSKYKRIEWDTFIGGIKADQRQIYIDFMVEIARNKNIITIFNPNEDATVNMDKAILRSILTVHADSGFGQKLSIGVQWGRVDLIEELLERDETTLTTEQKVAALNDALEQSLVLNRPEIYEILVTKGAEKGKVNLTNLYALQEAKYNLERLQPFAGVSVRNVPISEFDVSESDSQVRLLRSGGMGSNMDVVKGILNGISPMYARLLVDKKVTYTDLLVWAILVEREELAKAIWRHTVLPVHAALLACHLYKVLGDWFQGEETYQDMFNWFQKEAIDVLAELEYENAKPVLEWKWSELSANALQLSELAECKDFYAQPYVQRYLDEKLYSDDMGRIPPGTKMRKVLMLSLFPFTIRNSGYYDYLKPETRFWSFYSLPVVKFITSTLTYILFLLLLGVNVVGAVPCEYDIRPYEIILWIWIIAAIIEEFMQFIQDKGAYLELLTNQMDLTMYILMVAYIILRIITWRVGKMDHLDDGSTGNTSSILSSSSSSSCDGCNPHNAVAEAFHEAYTDVLIVATIICYLRLTNVFAFSKSLGPLFFVIIRLFNDVWQWLFIFFLFAASFQLGIFALTRQSCQNPWIGYPAGTLGSAFSVMVGDAGDNTMDYMADTHIGVYLLSIYSVIIQVMLVNLLIAMMGDTYSSVKENSDKEWKFYRYGLTIDYVSSSAYPPPLNLILGPIFYLRSKWQESASLYPLSSLMEEDRSEFSAKTITRMKMARERVLDKEREEEWDTLKSISSTVREHMRVASTTRDGDRLYLEYSVKNLETQLQGLKQQLDAIIARLPPPPGGAPLAASSPISSWGPQ